MQAAQIYLTPTIALANASFFTNLVDLAQRRILVLCLLQHNSRCPNSSAPRALDSLLTEDSVLKDTAWLLAY
jgi:hypothetical protein